MTQEELTKALRDNDMRYGSVEDRDGLLAFINQHVAEVIGEDTVGDQLNNMLRAEQRKRAGL